MSFFDSDIIQQEAKQLFEDYQQLTQLGGKYGKFDRDGKIARSLQDFHEAV
jgi:Domain of unknown function (DUF1825)